MQRGRTQPTNGGGATRPQPRRDRAAEGGNLLVFAQVDIAVDHLVVPAQCPSADLARGQRFTADERPIRLPHPATLARAARRMWACVTPSVDKRASTPHSPAG